MKQEDIEFFADILEKSRWLFYGDLDAVFPTFLQLVCKHELAEYGFRDIPMLQDFEVAYWLFLSEADRIGLVDYGTSPRGAWWTEEGDRFRKIVLTYPDCVRTALDFIYNKNH